MIAIDHSKHFATFVEADATVRVEIIVRRILMAISGLLLWIVLDNPLLALWGLGYLTGDIFYVRLLRSPSTVSMEKSFWRASIASLLLGSWVGAMPVYLAWIDGGALYFLSACIVVGQALHCLSSHNQIGAALHIDLAVVAGTTIGVTTGTAYHAANTETCMAILIGGAAVLAYFTHSVQKSVAERMALRRRSAAEAQDEKMRALGQFTSGVAHDFNNLLTVISGNIELARMTGVPHEPDMLLAEAEQASTNAAQLVRQLLAYSRRSQLSAQRLDLNAVAENFAAISARVLPATIAMDVKAEAAKVEVDADRAMLETALMNLVVNAKDAVGRAPGKITITVSENAGENCAMIAVRDNGQGMSEDVLAQAIDPFFTTKEVGQGSGLGLSMVSGFAEQSGGELRLANLSPNGFEAQLCLPLKTRPDSARNCAPLGKNQQPAE